MKESTSKEKILKSIRDAQLESTRQQKVIDVDMRSPLFPPIEAFADEHFAQFLIAFGGTFVHCKDEFDTFRKLRSVLKKINGDPIYTNEPDLEHFLTESGIDFLNYEQSIKKVRTVITFCECLVARFGTVVMSSQLKTGRKGHTFPDVHIVIAYKYQLLNEISEVFPFLQKKYGKEMPSMISYITGPSRTDIFEGEFVFGVNGSSELFVFYIDV